jgi:hypothetical protein
MSKLRAILASLRTWSIWTALILGQWPASTRRSWAGRCPTTTTDTRWSRMERPPSGSAGSTTTPRRDGPTMSHAAGLFSKEAPSAVPIGHCWDRLRADASGRPAMDCSGGERATVGRGIARTHACQHWRSRSARHALDRGSRRSEVATSVRSGGRGGSASHEAITSSKARSSSSGSASTTARNSYLSATSDLGRAMTDQTESGWRSSAVAEIT